MMPEVKTTDVETLKPAAPEVVTPLNLVTERPGYRAYTVTRGEQKGQQVLRIKWLSRDDWRALIRAQAAVPEGGGDVDGDIGPEARALYNIMARFIPEWTCVDIFGAPLPQPKDNPLTFNLIDPFETTAWLLNVNEGDLWADLFPKKAS